MYLDPKGSHKSNPFRNRQEFEKEYLNSLPPYTLLSWLEDFCNQLDCPPPEAFDGIEYFKRIGAWETQMTILEKLRYAIAYEKSKGEG